MGLDIEKLKRTIKQAEHSSTEGNIYKVRNKDGANGAYQFLDWWMPRIEEFARKEGYSFSGVEDFLNNSTLQDHYFEHYVQNEIKPQSQALQEYNSANLSEEQLLAGIHFLGMPTMKKVLMTNDFDSPKSYQTSLNDYFENAGLPRVEQQPNQFSIIPETPVDYETFTPADNTFVQLDTDEEFIVPELPPQRQQQVPQPRTFAQEQGVTKEDVLEAFFRDFKKGGKVDDAVGRKISKLMAEGKPQKQAVAIALSMQRRGELQEGGQLDGMNILNQTGEYGNMRWVGTPEEEELKELGIVNIEGYRKGKDGFWRNNNGDIQLLPNQPGYHVDMDNWGRVGKDDVQQKNPYYTPITLQSDTTPRLLENLPYVPKNLSIPQQQGNFASTKVPANVFQYKGQYYVREGNQTARKLSESELNQLKDFPASEVNPFVHRLDQYQYQEGGEVDPEMMFRNKYNTSLTPEEEQEFQKWLEAESKKRGRDISMDLGAYDVRGFWKNKDYERMDDRGHGTDMWKKPNHPTFSNESTYHNVDGYQGGKWLPDGGYQPSDFTKKLYDQSYYDWMFGQEPDSPEYLFVPKGGRTMVQPTEYCAGGLVRLDTLE